LNLSGFTTLLLKLIILAPGNKKKQDKDSYRLKPFLLFRIRIWIWDKNFLDPDPG
jgi:hypothetical protein